MSSDSLQFAYRFEFDDGERKSYVVEIDRASMLILPHKAKSVPNWTLLDNNKCEHCPLDSQKDKFCPIARNLSNIVEEFSDKDSFKRADVRVVAGEREYIKNVSLQEGLFSIFGLIMPISGCPHLRFLSPMARFHLPFSSQEETIVRSTSFYLLWQFFLKKKGDEADWDLKSLEDLYGKVKVVNKGILKRIQGITVSDADENALTVLQNFSQLLTMALSNDLSKIEPLFANITSIASEASSETASAQMDPHALEMDLDKETQTDVDAFDLGSDDEDK